MVMEEECLDVFLSICVAHPSCFFCIRQVKVFPFLDCIVHESLLSLSSRLPERLRTLSPNPFSFAASPRNLFLENNDVRFEEKH